jgi:high-affinity Fe2+/Pb2+ permease
VTSSPVPFHSALLGVYPTWETTLSQMMVLALVLVLWVYGKRPKVTKFGPTQTSEV